MSSLRGGYSIWSGFCSSDDDWLDFEDFADFLSLSSSS